MPLQHNWIVTPKEAIDIQKKLRDQVRITPLKKESLISAVAIFLSIDLPKKFSLE